MPEPPEVRGFAADGRALAERRALAGRLVGERIVQVDYVTLDHQGWELGHRDRTVRRRITDPAEWAEPAWDAGPFHQADFGVELVTEGGTIWGVTWDTPDAIGESLRLRPGVVCDGGAVWDVSSREPWRSCLGSAISSVALRYHPWAEGSGGFWCSRISLGFAGECVELLLGDRAPSGAELVPSADSIAVLVDPGGWPAWERTDDLV